MAPTMFWFQPSKVLQISAAELGGSSAESTEIPNPTGSVFAGLSDGVLLRWLKLMVFPVLPAETETPMSVPFPTKVFRMTVTLSAANRSMPVPAAGEQFPQVGGPGA